MSGFSISFHSQISEVNFFNLDCVFPSLKALLNRERETYVIRMVLKYDNNLNIQMSKETFFGLRTVLSDCLGKEAVTSMVKHEVSEEFRKKFELLEEHSELGKLYEQMVVKDQCTTQEEFFMNIAQYSQAVKFKRINEQENPINTDFFVPKRREGDGGDEIILMKVEDKLRLLDQFPVLKAKFESKFLGKFNDQPEEEAQFWDEFWRLQKVNNTLLFGGETKESKEIMYNLPIFSENGEHVFTRQRRHHSIRGCSRCLEHARETRRIV